MVMVIDWLGLQSVSKWNGNRTHDIQTLWKYIYVCVCVCAMLHKMIQSRGKIEYMCIGAQERTEKGRRRREEKNCDINEKLYTRKWNISIYRKYILLLCSLSPTLSFSLVQHGLTSQNALMYCITWNWQILLYIYTFKNNNNIGFRSVMI